MSVGGCSSHFCLHCCFLVSYFERNTLLVAFCADMMSSTKLEVHNIAEEGQVMAIGNCKMRRFGEIQTYCFETHLRTDRHAARSTKQKSDCVSKIQMFSTSAIYHYCMLGAELQIHHASVNNICYIL